MEFRALRHVWRLFTRNSTREKEQGTLLWCPCPARSWECLMFPFYISIPTVLQARRKRRKQLDKFIRKLDGLFSLDPSSMFDIPFPEMSCPDGIYERVCSQAKFVEDTIYRGDLFCRQKYGVLGRGCSWDPRCSDTGTGCKINPVHAQQIDEDSLKVIYPKAFKLGLPTVTAQEAVSQRIFCMGRDVPHACGHWGILPASMHNNSSAWCCSSWYLRGQTQILWMLSNQ